MAHEPEPTADGSLPLTPATSPLRSPVVLYPAEPLVPMQRAIALVTELLGDEGDVALAAELVRESEGGAPEVTMGLGTLVVVLLFEVAHLRGIEPTEVLQHIGHWVAVGADRPLFSE
jgi:hypothetical protein